MDTMVEIVIDGYINLKKEVKMGILQELPVSQILFFIYISRVFDVVSMISLKTMSILFMDDLGFLASENPIQEVVFSLEKISETVLRWGFFNAIIYDIAKIKTILFSKACGKKTKREVTNIGLVFGE